MSAFASRYDALCSDIARALRASAPDIDDPEWPEPAPGDEDPDPLFDSRRDYLTQIDRYKRHQGKSVNRRTRDTSQAEEEAEAAP